jgi:hypothetical protein
MKAKVFVRTQALILFSFIKVAQAADAEMDFTKIPIPNAVCGDGSAYSAYLREGDPKKVIVHFQGGGACWNSATCFGPTAFARLSDHGIEKDTTIFTTSELVQHPFENYTYLFIPYCTGDIFAGTHQGKYLLRKIEHKGRLNVERLISLIERNYSHPIARAEKLVVYGESAGAIGAILNLDLIESLQPRAIDKTLIADSPGLHFSEEIWSRFSDPYLADLSTALERNGLDLDLSSGLISKQMHTYCEKYSEWKIGIIQSTRDMIMSQVFGSRSQSDHENQVMGPDGIVHVLQNPHDACSSWVPHSSRHVWAVKKPGWIGATDDGTVLKDYVNNLLDSDLSSDFESHQ